MDDPSGAPDPKKRAKNFSKAETLALSEAVKCRYTVLFGKINPTVTTADKDKAWAEVVNEVNAVSSTVRTKSQCTEKYRNLKREVKKVAAHNKKEIKKTGGGPADVVEIDPTSQNVLDVIPQVSIAGIKAGIDTSDSGFGTEEWKNELALQLTKPSAHTGPSLALVSASQVENFERVPQSHVPARIPPSSDPDIEDVSEDDDDLLDDARSVDAVIREIEQEETRSGNHNAERPLNLPRTQQASSVGTTPKRKPMKSLTESLLEKQVELFEQQLICMREISASMKRRNRIELAKLKIKRSKTT